MTIARRHLVCPETTPYYHCVNRCVRRAFLCGKDTQTGRSFSHRKHWLEARLKQLTKVFAIDVCAYAIMENHYHVVVRLCPSRAQRWKDEEVLDRWYALFKGHVLVDRWRTGRFLSESEQAVVRTLIDRWRRRLVDLSWFMRCVNEMVARRANQEDGCTGHFWEGRFKSRALLDEAALLTCLSYVDLNPVRAGAAPTPEASRHTSIFDRIEALDGSGCADQQTALAPFLDSSERDPDRCLPFRLTDYLGLLDWAGRIGVADRRKAAMHGTLPDIMVRLGIKADDLVGNAHDLGRRPGIVLGTRERLRRFARHIGQSWVWGCGGSRPCLGSQ